jgi:hypothetical protein
MLPDPRFRPAPPRPDPVALVWIAGLALAAAAYAIGPDRLISIALDFFEQTGWYVDRLVHNLSSAAREVLRALAIGLYGTFLGLSVLAMRRHAQGQGPGGLIVVTIIFLLLVWGAQGDDAISNLRWAAALLLAALASVSATRRLTHPPPPDARRP